MATAREVSMDEFRQYLEVFKAQGFKFAVKRKIGGDNYPFSNSYPIAYNPVYKSRPKEKQGGLVDFIKCTWADTSTGYVYSISLAAFIYSYPVYKDVPVARYRHITDIRRKFYGDGLDEKLGGEHQMLGL